MHTVAIVVESELLALGIMNVLSQTGLYQAVHNGTANPDMVITTRADFKSHFPTLVLIDDATYVEVMSVLRAGAKGILMQNCSKEELLQAVKRIIGGGVYFCEEVQVIQLQTLSQAGATLTLTVREKEILRLFCDDRSPKEIACYLGVDRKTVDTHRRNLFAKLGIHSSLELFRYAAKNGLISLQ